MSSAESGPALSVPIDAMGTRHLRAGHEARIVSLVPSITELVCDLGLAGQLVGRTGFCIHPRAALRAIPKVGGTKDVDLAQVRHLAPTHVILNLDENRKETADALAGFVPNLLVTHPLGPLDNPPLYRLIGGVFGREAEAEALCRRFDAALAATTAALCDAPRRRVLYLIWKKPWMTVSRDTYIARTLALAGLDCVPGKAGVRYPAIELDAAMLAQTDIILLSSEPYKFRQRDVDAMRALPEMADRKVALVDGEMTSWYGSRAIAGVASLPALRAALDAA